MSQGTTQDFTPSPLDNLFVVEDSQEYTAGGAECVAMLGFEDTARAEKRDFALYPGEEILIGRDIHHAPSTYGKSFKQIAIHDGRVSKRHIRIYSIIYEQKNISESQSEILPPLVYCEDLESSNGTYVNGDLIGIIGRGRMAHLLCDGDVIEIRPTWKITFHQSNHQMIFPTSAQSRDMEHFNDRYIISDRILGSGHFGNVYLAKELPSNKQIACKIIDLEIAIRSISESRSDRSLTTATSRRSHVESARLHRKKVLLEIEILSKLSHPNIINIQKAFCSPHALYMFTDLAPAGDLYSYAQSKGGYLDDYDARVVIRQITLALAYLHSQDIAHRDVKQENVLVTSTEFGGRVMLTDFGFATHATFINGRMGRMLSKVGTTGFVAPEVDNVERTSLGYTKAADLWSLGVLTASLLTGTLDIPHADLQQLSQVEIADHFVGVDDSYARQQWIKMPPKALRFVRKLLVIDPDERMTATEALQHSWYTKPPREAQALHEGLQRINRFWEKRVTQSDKIFEALPGVIISSPATAQAPDTNFRRKLPDATSSPYFGLDRHLTQKAPSSRKRLLDDLVESGSSFMTCQTAELPKPIASISIHRVSHVRRAVSVEGTDLFGMSPITKETPHSRDLRINTAELIPTANLSGASSEEDGLDCINYTHGSEKHFYSKGSIPVRLSAAAAKYDNLDGKRYKASKGEPRTPDNTSNHNSRDIAAKPLRKTPRITKL